MAIFGNRNASEPKILDVDASFQGNLVFKDPVNLRVNGNFEGNLDAKGDLLIGENALVRANIVGERVTIAGNIEGDITALSEIRLLATARVIGNLKTPALVVEKGSIFHGNCNMSVESETPIDSGRRKIFFGVDEIADYLSVEKNLVAEWAETGKLPARREGQVWYFEKQKVDEWIANGRIV